MEQLKGYISKIVYANDQNGYKVCQLQIDTTEEVIVGIMPDVADGEMLEVQGEWVVHKIYDRQFKVSSYKTIIPEDTESMVRYLGSGVIKGIGPTLAQRIVKQFGTDSFRVIEETPEMLAQVKGITLNKAREIAVLMQEKRGFRDALIFLSKYGVGNNLAIKIYTYYNDRIYTIIKENPYRLAEDIPGVGFKTADEIAAKAGVRKDSDYRIQSGLLYTLLLASANGHMYLPKDVLVGRTAEIIGVDKEAIEPHILNLNVERKILIKKPDDVSEQPQVYAASNYYLEQSVAGMLKSVCLDCDVSEPEKSVMNKIERYAANEKIELDTIQKEAVVSAVTNGVSIITGGPGTGKTTIINTIIKYFVGEGLDIALCAPTGRAAKRMTEATGYEAKTIHRLLEVNGSPEEDGRVAGFERNEDNPLETDAIIVDEMSMVDVFMFNALLKAVSSGTRLVLVGDSNQLPSVGPGQVLKDLIDSGCFSVTMLKKVFRQEGTGDIVINAHKIHNGEFISIDNKSKDFFFLKRDDVNRILKNTVELITERLPGYVNATPLDIQVLTPTRKGALGVEALNRYLQDALNPPKEGKKEHLFGETVFRVGDKVMQIRNDYKAEWEVLGKYNIPIDSGLGVFNGDMGRIVEINEMSTYLTVEFDDKRRVDYAFSNLDELEHAYAITVHKSQGSEYSAVVMPIVQGPRQLMNRNLLYTAVTRAKQCLVILGDEEAVRDMIDNNEENTRYSGLRNRIIEIMALN